MFDGSILDPNTLIRRLFKYTKKQHETFEELFDQIKDESEMRKILLKNLSMFDSILSILISLYPKIMLLKTIKVVLS